MSGRFKSGPRKRTGPTARQKALLTRILGALENQSEGLSPRLLAGVLVVPVQAIEAIVPLGLKDGSLVLLGDDLYATAEIINRATDSLRQKFGARVFSPREMREALGATRRWTEPLAAHLAEKGTLWRVEGGMRLSERA